MNLTIIQLFHWYSPGDGTWWKFCSGLVPELAAKGITHVYLPPAYKSAFGDSEPGYAVYDLFDLGEFEQKGSVRTKYGTRNEYLDCIKAFHASNIQVIADIVLNHKHGGDEKETITVQEVNINNRNETIGERYEIEAYTKFYFPGRNKKYSTFVWDHHCFTGIDKENENGRVVYIIPNEYGDSWEELIDDEFGNYDYLMGADIEFRNPHVRNELKWWGQWYIETSGIDGFRLDAVKHITPHFFTEWLDHLKGHFRKDFFCVGEYWRQDVEVLLKYIDAVDGRMQLFDVPLHFNFHKASAGGNDYDMRQIFDNTLIQRKPELSVTFVDNHDTQPLQALESPVDHWFKPLAYALILLREQGTPCVFYPALYGAAYSDKKGEEEITIELKAIAALDKMLLIRKELAYGLQRDYFDHANTIGWTREGIAENAGSGCAVLMTNGTEGDKTMEMGKRHSGKLFIDACGGRREKVTIDADGFGKFYVNSGSVSVWVCEEGISIFN